jgi:predicted PurR-regulated permease PerM
MGEDEGAERPQKHPPRTEESRPTIVSLEGTPWRWIGVLIAGVIVALIGYRLVVGVIVQLKDLLFWMLTSLFLSFALEPAVSFLAKRGWRRGVATLALLGGLTLLGVLLLALMVPVLVDQLAALVNASPEIISKIGVFTERYLGIELSPEAISGTLQQASRELAGIAGDVVGNILGFGSALVGAIFQFLSIGLFTFYLVADGPQFRRSILSFIPPKRQEAVLWTWEVAIDKTGAYLYSRLVLAVLSGLATFIVLRILGVPFALPLAVWMGLVSQFIPTVGTYIAMALPLLVAVVHSPVDALILLVFFVLYQQLENFLLAPRITARTMQMHPALAFGAAVAGVLLGGLVGALLAIPAAAIIQAVVSTAVERHEVVQSPLTDDRGKEPGPPPDA